MNAIKSGLMFGAHVVVLFIAIVGCFAATWILVGFARSFFS